MIHTHKSIFLYWKLPIYDSVKLDRIKPTQDIYIYVYNVYINVFNILYISKYMLYYFIIQNKKRHVTSITRNSVYIQK